MLVLSRRSGEQIVIGQLITVEIRRITGNRVAIGVEAPEHVRVLRGELEVADGGPRADAAGGEGPGGGQEAPSRGRNGSPSHGSGK